MEQPSLYRQIVHGLLKLFGLKPQSKQSPMPYQLSPTEPPRPVTRKVSLIINDPTIPGSGGQPLTAAMGWNNPDRLAAELISDLREISHGYANFEIVDRVMLDEFPVKMDGFRYDPDEYVALMRAGRGFHMPDDVNYEEIIRKCSLVEKVAAGKIDEAWIISFPYGGLYESRMGGPGSFWCNAPALQTVNEAQRRFVIMGFNFERGVGEMLESFGHRAESIMEQVFRNIPAGDNLWKRYILYDKVAPGQAEVGNVHFAPNSVKDYDWGNPTPVPSRCRNWAHFPDLSGDPVIVDCREWGSGDIRAHHRWWFSLMPHIQGKQHGIAFNWWEYIVDPNHAR